MKILLAITAVPFIMIALAPAASAIPLVDIVGPHPDANGGATCVDAIAGHLHVGACEGAASCPLYYDDYRGDKGCESTPRVNLHRLPFFEIVGFHNDANPTGAQCSDVFVRAHHFGACAGDLGCPLYVDTYAGYHLCV